MKYKFKTFVSTTEMAEVMMQIKWSFKTKGKEGLTITQEQYESYPHLQSYFEPVKSK